MVMKPEPWGEALDALVPAGRRGSASDRADPAGRAVHPGAGPRTGRPGVAPLRVRTLRGHRRPGGRARRVPGWRCSRSASATTCSTAGEVAALAIVEAVVRLLPGRPGQPGVAGGGVPRRRAGGPAGVSRSTRSRHAGGVSTCPPVLLSGHHGQVAAWRLEQSRLRTADRRPGPAGAGEFRTRQPLLKPQNWTDRPVPVRDLRPAPPECPPTGGTTATISD